MATRIVRYLCDFCEEEFHYECEAAEHEEICPFRDGTCKECAYCDAEGHRWGPCPKNHFAPQNLSCDHYTEAKG